MEFERLRAKSERGGDRNSVPQTILEHTVEVMAAAERLVEVTGKWQLNALGLDPDVWIGRLRRELLLAAFLHDLGKAGDHFQGMIWRIRTLPQAIRHEAISFWIATRPIVRDWVRPALGDSPMLELVLWAIAGHHRKFPPQDPREAPEVCLLLSHRDFRDVLVWGAERLGLGPPPELAEDFLRFSPSRRSVIREFENAQVDAVCLMKRLSHQEKRYLALLKACLICADVAGSIGRTGNRTMAEWIEQAFRNVPTVAVLDQIVTKKLGASRLHGFQEQVGARKERVVLVRAGCGSGKTLAAYHWAARQAERLGRDLRVFFCYPTTGTATEGYRDYLKDPELGAALVHGRAEIDMEMLGLGDDEPDKQTGTQAEDFPGRALNDSAGALDQWSTPLVSCTVDTVLGLIQNHRRGIYAWPSIAGSALVFDEIHSYDDALFAALLRFLVEVRGLPCLLMTASLPAERLGKLQAALASLGETLGEVPGPESSESLRRYRRDGSASPWDRVHDVLIQGGKVLWVVNTVDEAMSLFEDPRAKAARAILYHSRFRYVDRVAQHQQVIAAFRLPKRTSAFAITTQVAEMSLDLSADLLVTQLAPIPALIQRLGRLNRRAERDDPWPFLVYEPDPPPPGYPLPYEQRQIDEAKVWLEMLDGGDLSQRDLIKNWKMQPAQAQDRPDQFIWLDGGFVTEPRPLREASPGIEVILSSDREALKRNPHLRPDAFRIPMPRPKDPRWLDWPEIAFCKVPPEELIDYHPTRGARWTR